MYNNRTRLPHNTLFSCSIFAFIVQCSFCCLIKAFSPLRTKSIQIPTFSSFFPKQKSSLPSKQYSTMQKLFLPSRTFAACKNYFYSTPLPHGSPFMSPLIKQATALQQQPLHTSPSYMPRNMPTKSHLTEDAYKAIERSNYAILQKQFNCCPATTLTTLWQTTNSRLLLSETAWQEDNLYFKKLIDRLIYLDKYEHDEMTKKALLDAIAHDLTSAFDLFIIRTSFLSEKAQHENALLISNLLTIVGSREHEVRFKLVQALLNPTASLREKYTQYLTYFAKWLDETVVMESFTSMLRAQTILLEALDYNGIISGPQTARLMQEIHEQTVQSNIFSTAFRKEFITWSLPFIHPSILNIVHLSSAPQKIAPYINIINYAQKVFDGHPLVFDQLYTQHIITAETIEGYKQYATTPTLINALSNLIKKIDTRYEHHPHIQERKKQKQAEALAAYEEELSRIGYDLD